MSRPAFDYSKFQQKKLKEFEPPSRIVLGSWCKNGLLKARWWPEDLQVHFIPTRLNDRRARIQ